ncbi:class I mannose-6-phosphate isomerase [Peribacillus loiseleuriae]|uniref:Mannose-6-phosphate isomerase n=1 Tax=Peribacillus loiseleuriae TaxID=1679170 RepID=A0A0K9GTJ9_9BACI|nr:class I mannose-6-phosphate isomerase [Peribacillus loiseleuriae]KMY49971.1 mannose-6-phosphate isomerase [Peribacillus loiseleuriae]
MSHYELAPEIKIKQFEGVWSDYRTIANKLIKVVKDETKSRTILAIECYPGVRNEEFEKHLIPLLAPKKIIFADDIAMDGTEITEMVKRTLTDDRVFGVMSHYELDEFFPKEKVKAVQEEIATTEGLIVIYGTGATVIAEPDILVYADLARWEIQCRYRSGEIGNWKMENYEEDALRKYKRGFFFEWRTADRHKKKYFDKIDFLLDTNVGNEPKMVSGTDFRQALRQVASAPFRVVPYFDASVWGGQWMKERFNLDPEAENYGWAFDGVPEENSLYLRFGDVKIEVPSINVVFQHPNELLGPKVHSRFGTEFPIRFDYLDTVGGGNLSLQVHPSVEYIQDKFGRQYTQDESYYILDAQEDSTVYLGVKEGTTKEELMADLEKAAKGNYRFQDEKYINVFPVKKHDHILIPAGTIHCSGPNTVVLEISASQYIFTFKLWDWDRVGLDGLPRPVHLEHGRENLQMNRDTKWVKENLINQFEILKDENGVKTERTGLHELEFIETQRHWFEDKVTLETHDSVNMLNLVEGTEVVVESVDDSFEPFEVHYGETFIVPECVKKYTIRNTSTDSNQKVAVIQAFVRNL